MDNNEAYIQNVKVEEIPWHRITTAYGRATDFPRQFGILWNMADMAQVKSALDEITSNTEHQSTLWHATPFTMIILARIFEHAISQLNQNKIADFITEQLLDFFVVIAECFHDGNEMDHAQQLPNFSDMLKEHYLWSEDYDEEEDELRYEEEYLFPDDLFYSFWYYSYQVLLVCKPLFEPLEHTSFGAGAKELQKLL